MIVLVIFFTKKKKFKDTNCKILIYRRGLASFKKKKTNSLKERDYFTIIFFDNHVSIFGINYSFNFQIINTNIFY